MLYLPNGMTFLKDMKEFRELEPNLIIYTNIQCIKRY